MHVRWTEEAVVAAGVKYFREYGRLGADAWDKKKLHPSSRTVRLRLGSWAALWAKAVEADPSLESIKHAV